MSDLPFRPFRPGERINNPDGSYSTEVTITVEDGNGGWMVVPQLFMGPKGVIDLRDNPDAAANAAYMLRDRFGVSFPVFKTVDEANSWAQKRSLEGGASDTPINGLLD